jgi:hypothetical protein
VLSAKLLQLTLFLIFFDWNLIPLCYSIKRMNVSSLPANTFVLRFWLERSISGARWRGRIEHIPSGERSEFLRVEELLKFFQKFQIMLDDTDRSECQTK